MEPEAVGRSWTRRRFLKMAVASGALLSGGTAAYARYCGPFTWHVRELDLPIEGLPSSLVGKRLIQISDLHVGPVVDHRYMQEVFAHLHELRGDLLVVTGDFISYDRHNSPWKKLLELFTSLPNFPLGVYGIVGNHDYGKDWSQPQVAEELFRVMADTPLRFLHNEVIDVGGLQLAGVGDLWTESYDAESMFSQLRPERPKLVLCHNPDVIDLPAWSEYDGWMLSGHTHGGQCWFPVIGAPITPIRNKRYRQGVVVSDRGIARLYINPGLGYTRQVRFLVPPEITVFTLQIDQA